MTEYHRNRRLDRRIPLGSPALIRLEDGSEWEAECIEISVGGMTLHATYVPGEAEQFEVVIEAPESSVTRPPLVVRVVVKRCVMFSEGVYEMGLETVKVLG